MALTVETQRHAGRQVLAAGGELDLVTAPELTNIAFDLVDAGEPDIIIDASRLDFCDSAGLTAFVRIANRLEPNGRLAIAGASAMVHRVLEVSGLVEAFLVVDTVPRAVEQLDAE